MKKAWGGWGLWISQDYITGFSLKSSFKSFITFDKKNKQKGYVVTLACVCVNELCEDTKATGKSVSVCGGWVENWKVERKRERMNSKP